MNSYLRRLAKMQEKPHKKMFLRTEFEHFCKKHKGKTKQELERMFDEQYEEKSSAEQSAELI